MDRRRKPRLSPVLGIVLYFVAWSGQLAAGAHSGVPHVRCNEHGELSHITIAAAHAVAAPARSMPAAGSQERSHAGGHEHCPIAAVIDQSARPTRSAPAPATPIE